MTTVAFSLRRSLTLDAPFGARRWINWPFSSGPDDGFTSDLINFTASRHSQRVAGSDSQGVRVQMYYTTRELSNRAAEMPVLRSVRPNA